MPLPVKSVPGATQQTSANKVDQEPSASEQGAYDTLSTSQKGEKLRSLFRVIQEEYRDEKRTPGNLANHVYRAYSTPERLSTKEFAQS